MSYIVMDGFVKWCFCLTMYINLMTYFGTMQTNKKKNTQQLDRKTFPQMHNNYQLNGRGFHGLQHTAHTEHTEQQVQ